MATKNRLTKNTVAHCVSLMGVPLKTGNTARRNRDSEPSISPSPMALRYSAAPERVKLPGSKTPEGQEINLTREFWSGRRDSNPRPQPWQGCALPLSYARYGVAGGAGEVAASYCASAKTNARRTSK